MHAAILDEKKTQLCLYGFVHEDHFHLETIDLCLMMALYFCAEDHFHLETFDLCLNSSEVFVIF